MVYTTLNRIREHSPCAKGWTKLLKHLGKTKPDDEPLSFATILDSNGLDDALWCCRAEPEQASLWRHFAVDCAESVRHLMQDKHSTNALDVARRHANGQATDEALGAARDAAWDAARAAAWDAARDDAARDAAMAAARDAAWAAARDAAWDAARDAAMADAAMAAAWDAARDAALAAAMAAAWAAAWGAARDAAWAAARDAAWAAARAAMAQRFRHIVTVGAWTPVEEVEAEKVEA